MFQIDWPLKIGRVAKYALRMHQATARHILQVKHNLGEESYTPLGQQSFRSNLAALQRGGKAVLGANPSSKMP
jgi:hypothetical protein